MYTIDQLRIFTEPQQGASYDDLLAVARRAETLGFGAFFRSDHYLAMGAPTNGGLPGPSDAWITLAGLARDTTTIRLGTLVSPATFRHPSALAIAVANVDAMSGGRAELGVGAGWYRPEHEAYGIPFPELSERFDRLAEQLAVVTGLWCTPIGERFSFDGVFVTLRDSPALPKPIQQPVPIIVGGRGQRRTPALAAQFASEFNCRLLLPRRLHRAAPTGHHGVRGDRPRPGDRHVLDRAHGGGREHRVGRGTTSRRRASRVGRASPKRRGRHGRRGDRHDEQLARGGCRSDVSASPRPR